MRIPYEQARLALARLKIAEAANEREVLRTAARISARTLDIERVGIWMFDATVGQIQCKALYTRASDSYEDGTVIRACDAAAYFAALGERRVIGTRDAITDPVTRDLAASYLILHGIGAMLDAPIYVDGELVGVVCHEHVGGARNWTAAEIDFAGTFGDVLASLYLQRRLRVSEAAVRLAASRVQEAQRIANLTQVVRTLAHDVNNVLTVTALHASRLARDASPELASIGRDLEAASEFGGRILRDLQLFAARDESERAPIGDVIERFQPMLRALVKNRVDLDLFVEEPRLLPAASRTHVEQILLNLVTNARDASPDGAVVTVRAGRAEAGLFVEVEDHGTGIVPDVRSHIFEPYVTTKSDGTGLGLSIVDAIVTELGGTIGLTSEVGKGTTFRVELPLQT
jgi:two-component system, cell cycle sensor histidine kinase and response regulator CckA